MPIDYEDGLPRHPREWTLEEFFDLPEEQGRRIELVDGALVMSPAPTDDHQDIVGVLFDQMRSNIPAGRIVRMGSNVIIGADRVLIPDLIVVERGPRGRKASLASELLMAVEIVSPSSRQFDYMNKRKMYAEAGVPHYLIVDPTKSRIVIESHELHDGGYELVRRSDDGTLKVDRPYPISLDLNEF